jgi:nitrous oxidase accessory protein NosD
VGGNAPRLRRVGTLAVAWLLASIAAPGITIAQDGSSPPPAATVTPAPPPCVEPLQALIDAAAPGSTVQLPACTSGELLRVTHPLTLEGRGTLIDVAGASPHGLIVEADDVTVVGLRVRGATTPPQDGAVRAWDVDRFAFLEGTIEDSAGACISVARGSDALVADSTLARCGQEGLHATRADGLVVRGNRIHGHNAERAFDPEWEAGGAKVTVSRDVVFEANDVFANVGPGIWCDIDCFDLVVRGNRTWDNDRAGIMVEISAGAIVEGNATWENGWGKQSWGWGAGILVSSSRDVLVRDNVVAWNADGIVVVSQGRPDAPVPISTVRTSANTIAMIGGGDAFGLAWLQDWPGVLFAPDGDSGGSGDRFWFDRPEGGDSRFAWDGSFSRIEDFRATPGGSDAAYLTDAELTAILTARGIPTGPAPEHPVPLPSPRELAPLLLAALVVVLGLGLAAALYIRRRRRLAATSRRPEP